MINSSYTELISLSLALEKAGLVWHPQIGDEVSERSQFRIMILTDNNSLTPSQLRKLFVWLPRMEQIIEQIEARNGIITFFGWNSSPASFGYLARMEISGEMIETSHVDPRLAIGALLFKFLQMLNPKPVLH